MLKLMYITKRPEIACIVEEAGPLDADSPLWEMDNVAISPHKSFVSDGNNTRMFEVIYHNLKTFIKTQV